MYIGILFLKSENHQGQSELCLFPEKVSPLFSPIPISAVMNSSAALCFISPEEAFKTEIDNDGAITITPFLPNKLYLTPNRSEKPGFSVTRVKVFRLSEGDYRMFFDRDKGWEEYTPLIKDY